MGARLQVLHNIRCTSCYAWCRLLCCCCCRLTPLTPGLQLSLTICYCCTARPPKRSSSSRILLNSIAWLCCTACCHPHSTSRPQQQLAVSYTMMHLQALAAGLKVLGIIGILPLCLISYSRSFFQ